MWTWDWKIAGAFAFGVIIGWYIYYVNRYRKSDVQMSDLTSVIGAVGGAAVLALFDKGSDMFGAYGIGLAVGFFAYFISLLILVKISPNFDADWFLDGRRKDPPQGVGYGQQVRPPMALPPEPAHAAPGGFHGLNPGAAQQFFINSGPATPMVPAAQMLPTARAVTPEADRIIEACKDVWSGKKDACNFFVIAVADQLGVTLSGRADDIVDEIRGADWSRLKHGVAARDAAKQGRFIVAGMKSTEFDPPRSEGHVAIVVTGAMNPAGWAPAGYWGSMESSVAEKGGMGSPISLCFRASDQAKITYAHFSG